MTRGMVTALRAGIVALYAFIGAVLCGDGTSAGDLTGMFILGIVFLVGIVAADWINEAPRRGK